MRKTVFAILLILSFAVIAYASDVDTYTEWGMQAYQKGNYHAASQYFSNVINSGGGTAGIYYLRAMCYIRLGKKQEAFSDMTMACSLGHQGACDMVSR